MSEIKRSYTSLARKSVGIADEQVRNYHLHPSDAEEAWLTHALTASFDTYTSAKGGSGQSEGMNAMKIANFPELLLPSTINKEKKTITLHGLESSIALAAKLLSIRGFTEEK